MSISQMKPQCPKGLYCLIFILLLGVNTAQAQLTQNQNEYAVNDIAIKASGKTPNDARTNAIAAGQRNAFIILLQRLGIDESAANALKNDAIDDMVASKQIVDEKIAGNNYSATLNLTFSESFIKHYLGKKIDAKNENKADIADTANSNSFLIVPIKIVKTQPSIWEGNNDWKTALENAVKNNKISSLKLLKGDIEDIGTFNSGTVNSGNYTNFESAFNKYKVDALVLAFFEFDSIENKVNITLKTIKKFQTAQVRLDFVNVNQLPIADLVDKVAGKTIEYFITHNAVNASSNTSQTQVPTASSLSNINIDVLISNLSDWLTIKNKLENLSIVSNLKVNSLSKDLVKISVVYNSSNGEIINFFAKNNLSLQKKPEGGYFLSLIKS